MPCPINPSRELRPSGWILPVCDRHPAIVRLRQCASTLWQGVPLGRVGRGVMVNPMIKILQMTGRLSQWASRKALFVSKPSFIDQDETV